MSTKKYSRLEPIIGVRKYKKQYLFGVDLRDSDGNVISDSVISDILDMAISYLEMELNVPLYPQELTHYEDYSFAAYRNFVFIQLPIYPIASGSVTAVRLHFNDSIGIDFPQEWFKVYEDAGQIQLLPNVSTLSAVLIAQCGQLLPRAIHSNQAPQLLKVTYKAGIANTEDKIPPVVNRAIGLIASIALLQMIGDIGPGGAAGITAQSLSVDGLSQTINTAISATNNLFGATIESYRKELDKTTLPLLKRRYKRLRVEFI
jgi:hypothetical protein